MAPFRNFRSSYPSIAAICICVLAGHSSFAADYVDSQKHSDFVQEKAQDTNGDLFVSLMGQLGTVVTACGTAVGVTSGAAVVDTVPLNGMVKSATALSGSALKFLKYAGKSLKIHELPYFVATLEALAPIGDKISTMKAGALLSYLSSAMPHVGTQSAYAERVAGTILGFYSESPKDLGEAVDTLAPHFMGGAIAAWVDYGLFNLASASGLDRSHLPEGKITAEAFRATVIAAREGFSKNSACGVAKTNFDTAVSEVLMRNSMMKRPGPVEQPATAATFNSSTVSSSPKQARADAARPYGGADNGGPDFQPRSDRPL